MRGLLLVNLGTPDAPTARAVRRYLREFLSDPRVLDINPFGRFLLLNLIILPLRPKKSAAAYQKIWTERGSPLLFHSKDLADKVQGKLGEHWRVELAMRYGNPSIEAAMARLRGAGVDEVVVLPLYPHYASSSTGSSLEKVYAEAGRTWNTARIITMPPFYVDPGFIEAFVELGRARIHDAVDHVLFSFHGLPERHMLKSDDTGSHCLVSSECCNTLSKTNRNCYRAQCFATAGTIAERLGLPIERYTVTFQSRLGRTPWIKPYTDAVLDELAAKGIKNLVVFCPAFVADCLETMEEIGIRAHEQWKSAGGAELTLVPSLNSSPRWVDAVCDLVRGRAPVTTSPC